MLAPHSITSPAQSGPPRPLSARTIVASAPEHAWRQLTLNALDDFDDAVCRSVEAMTERAARRVVAVLAVVCVAALGFSALTGSSRPSTLIPVEAGSSAGSADESVPIDIDGVEWEIASVDGRPVGDALRAWFLISSTPPADGQFVNDSADGNLFVTGNDGCNTYSSRGQLSDGLLTVSGGMTTLMYCPPPLAGLQSESRLAVRDGWLIVDATTTLLAFDRAGGRPASQPPVIPEPSVPVTSEPVSTVAIGTDQPMPDGFAALAGSRWVLTAVEGQPWQSSFTPSFTIGNGVAFSGHDGCNRYVGNWWLDGASLVVRADEPAQLLCRANVPPDLRPAGGFRFEFDGDVARSGPLQPGISGGGSSGAPGTTQLMPLPQTTLAVGDEPQIPEPAVEPYVTFERLAPGTPLAESNDLVGTWQTIDGIAVEFTPSELIVGDCGPVAEWSLTDRLTITRIWDNYQRCAILAESTSLAMLLLDTRSPEQLEILSDGRLLHISDTAFTVLQPV